MNTTALLDDYYLSAENEGGNVFHIFAAKVLITKTTLKESAVCLGEENTIFGTQKRETSKCKIFAPCNYSRSQSYSLAIILVISSKE